MTAPLRAIAVALLLGGLVLSGCQSAPEEIPPDLSQMEMFQRAQEAVDQERYETALAYYREFRIRFADDPGALIEADYEIAFINYKMGNYERSRELFNEILATYEESEPGALPQWPLVLAQKLIETVEQRLEQSGPRWG